MARLKKKTLPIKETTTEVVDNPNKLLKKDLETLMIDSDLYDGIYMVTQAMRERGFHYDYNTNDGGVILTFENRELIERITINIEKENLLVRHFEMATGDRKLKVIYVVKPSTRNFKLV